MLLSIHQPSYFPWLGLLDKIAKSDTFVLLDDVQVVKGTYQYRNIFFNNGKAKHLTLPINYSLGITFDKLLFKNDTWPAKHLDLLRNYYLKAPYFNLVYKDIEILFGQLSEMKPIDVLKRSMEFCFDKLNIRVNVLLSSKIPYQGKKADMVLEICKSVKTDHYISGMGAFEYMTPYLDRFKDEGIQVVWHKFKHPEYKQHPKFSFVGGLSVLDLFFFVGYEKANEIFWGNIETNGT